jgi:myo-inositol-1(or 4)-monophosphatase
MPRSQKNAKRAALELRHRINAGRVAVQSQIGFFGKLFGHVASDWKPDNTRVTFADFAISERILQALREDFPGDDFISEEAVPADEVVSLNARYAWVLDPVDGTNNYALGFPACAIALALLCNGEPIYGYVYDHSSRCLFEGGPHKGLLVDGRKIITPQTADETSQVLIGLHFPIAEADLNALAALLSKHKVRAFGSIALSTALTATGYLGALFETKGHLWDIAAGIALLAAAGRSVAFQDASPFPLRTFSYQSPPARFVAGAPCWVESLKGMLGGQWMSYAPLAVED